jgi:hypothetical protein
MQIFITLFLAIFNSNLWARSLRASADKLARDTASLGQGIALIGIIFCGIYFLIGKQDAITKTVHVLIGSFIILGFHSIFDFVKGVI